MDRKAPIITRNSIFGLHCYIPNMSDRPRSQKGALNPGTSEQSGASWAGKSAPLPMTFENSATIAADSMARKPRGAV